MDLNYSMPTKCSLVLIFQSKYRSNFGQVDVAPAKNDKVNKEEKWQKSTAGLNPNHMHIFKA